MCRDIRKHKTKQFQFVHFGLRGLGAVVHNCARFSNFIGPLETGSCDQVTLSTLKQAFIVPSSSESPSLVIWYPLLISSA